MRTGRRGVDQAPVLMSSEREMLVRIDERLIGLQGTCNGLVATLSQKADLSSVTNLRLELQKVCTDAEKITKELSDRIRELEKFSWRQAGVYAFALALLGLFLAIWRHFSS